MTESSKWEKLRSQLDAIIARQYKDGSENPTYTNAIGQSVCMATFIAESKINALIDRAVKEKSLQSILTELQECKAAFLKDGTNDDGFGAGTLGAIIRDVRKLQEEFEA